MDPLSSATDSRWDAFERSSWPPRMGRHPLQIAAYIRIAAVSVAIYDFLLTQPTAWRFYREHWNARRLNISIILFIAIRWTSICVLIFSTVGFFYDRFTPTACLHFHLIPPIFKVIQTMVSQTILGIRVFNLSRRSKRVGYFLLITYCITCTLQWVTTIYGRKPEVGRRGMRNCKAADESHRLGAYIFYVIAIGYDILTTILSMWFLQKYKNNVKNTVVSQLRRMMLYDGIGYLIVLTAANVLNALLFLEKEDVQTAGASLGYCVTWIMSQRLLIHLYDASRERREEEELELAGGSFTLSKNITGHRNISRAVRSQLDIIQTTDRFDLGGVPRDSLSTSGYPDDLNVSVRIERTVKSKRVSRTIELEDYSRRNRTDH